MLTENGWIVFVWPFVNFYKCRTYIHFSSQLAICCSFCCQVSSNLEDVPPVSLCLHCGQLDIEDVPAAFRRFATRFSCFSPAHFLIRCFRKLRADSDEDTTYILWYSYTKSI